MDPDPLSCLLLLSGLLAQAVEGQPAIVFHAPTLGSIVAIAVALVGLLLSAFNSGSEIAFFSLKKSQTDDIADTTQRERIAELLRNPERLLATILIANNLVNVMIIIVLNYAMNQMMTFTSPVADFVVQTVILTFLILLFGEIIPKLYATSHNLRFAVAASGALGVAVKVLSPLSRVLVGSTRIVGRVATRQSDDLSTDDLSRALEASDVQNGDEKELLEGILTFGEKTVSAIMRPRVDVVDIDIASTWDEVVAKVIDTGYSRMPVYDDQPDNIKGILYAKDLLPYIGKRDSSFAWQSLIRPAYFVPESRMIDDLLEDFRKKKTHMAIIVDEYGCTQGIATLEDVLEEIVGDIDDEYDTEERFYTRVSPNTYVFDGKTLLSDFVRVLDIDIDTLGKHGEQAETLAGLLLDVKGDFFTEQETLDYECFQFKVLKTERYRIDKIQVVVK